MDGGTASERLVAATIIMAALVALPAHAYGQLVPLSPSALRGVKREQAARVERAAARLSSRRRIRGLDRSTTFELRSVHTDAFGQTHARFAQRHAGAPVWGAEIVTHTAADGSELPATDTLMEVAGVTVVPRLSASDATRVASSDRMLGGAQIKASVAELVVYPVEVERVPAVAGRPVNAQDVRRDVVGYLLAWHLRLSPRPGTGVAERMDYLVDAIEGRILERWSSLETAIAAGVGHSQYSGRVVLETTEGSGFSLTDSAGNQVLDAACASDVGGLVYQDGDGDWGDGQQWVPGFATTSPRGQTAAVDVAYGIQRTWMYLAGVHGRNGIDGAGRPISGYAHLGANYANAFWEDECFCAAFGDGSASSGYGSLTPLDIVGHELAHGLVSSSANLLYKRESGGLNEATADIFGTMIDSTLAAARAAPSASPVETGPSASSSAGGRFVTCGSRASMERASTPGSPTSAPSTSTSPVVR